MAEFYKVLVDRKSCHGGTLEWTPGAWHEVEGDLKLCRHGLHVTTKPAHWFVPKCEVWPVEAVGVEGEPDETGKVVARKVRLGDRPLTAAELVALQIFYDGAHEVRDGLSIANGSSSVVALDSSRVVAWGLSRVEAQDSSHVVARDSSRVVAWGSSRVEAQDSSSVEAWGSSSVVARGWSNLILWSGSATLHEQAAGMDRRNGAPKFLVVPAEVPHA